MLVKWGQKVGSDVEIDHLFFRGWSLVEYMQLNIALKTGAKAGSHSGCELNFRARGMSLNQMMYFLGPKWVEHQ